METEIPPPTEKRKHVRHRANTMISIKLERAISGTIRNAVNLSVNGVGILTEGMGLKNGQTVDLSFAIYLGDIVKIHKRRARVVHVTSGVTGFFMEQYTGK
jgi:hypothetical protein